MHQLFVVERKAQVRSQITVVAARAESGVCSNARKCSRTQITARAGYVRRGAALRATVVLRAACDVRPWCCMLRATVVLLAAWVRLNAPSAVECTMAGSSL
jgi:hypothetical protein